jgi:hypothetical protein
MGSRIAFWGRQLTGIRRKPRGTASTPVLAHDKQGYILGQIAALLLQDGCCILIRMGCRILLIRLMLVHFVLLMSEGSDLPTPRRETTGG